MNLSRYGNESSRIQRSLQTSPTTQHTLLQSETMIGLSRSGGDCHLGRTIHDLTSAIFCIQLLLQICTGESHFTLSKPSIMFFTQSARIILFGYGLLQIPMA